MFGLYAIKGSGYFHFPLNPPKSMLLFPHLSQVHNTFNKITNILPIPSGINETKTPNFSNYIPLGVYEITTLRLQLRDTGKQALQAPYERELEYSTSSTSSALPFSRRVGNRYQPQGFSINTIIEVLYLLT